MKPKILSNLLLFVALAFPQFAHALPHFRSAKWADLREVDNAEIGTRTPLVLVHGIQSDASMWTNFLLYYNSTPVLKDNFKPYVFEYYTQKSLMTPGDDPISIEGVGRALGSYLQQWKTVPTRSPFFGFNDKQVVVMAHSMGGLVARSMMQNYRFADNALGREKVSLLITLATPHHGTPVASEFYVTPNTYQQIATVLFDLHPEFAFDMAWDCSDGRKFGWFCGAQINSSVDFSKIITYGGTVATLTEVPAGSE
jgi:triacylglycerol esterase/lipase EstA (alpha/beta hydrolase family)